MKILKQSILLFTSIIFITVAACKKYPDGPLISFHSKEKRVVGEWLVDYYSINGYDSTSYLQAKPYYGKYSLHAPRGDNSPAFDLVSNNGTYCTFGNWRFTNNKKNLFVSQQDGCNSSISEFNANPFVASNVTWEIRRLTEKDLWFKTTYNGKEYFMKLKH